MVTLAVNREGFINDAAEVIRAFLGMVEIRSGALCDAPGPALEVCLTKSLTTVHGWMEAGGAAATCVLPFEEGNDGALFIKRRQKRAVKTAVYRVMRQLLPDVVLPWGALTGIRPTKLLRELMETEGEAEALRMFEEDFDVKRDKAALARRIIAAQRPILARIAPRDVDVYVGIPYCKTRCLYCSFASEVAGKHGVPEEYLAALHADIRLGASLAREGGYRPGTLYIGGGTPTVLTAAALARLIDHVLNCYGVPKEFTVEAGRPDTIDAEKLRVLLARGVTRLSLNPQSMHDETLQRIGRGHSAADILRTYVLVRDMGFTSVNMDVIAGLPGEGLEEFGDTLSQIEALGPENLTVHTLAVKRSSRLKERLEAYPLPGAEETEAMVALGACAAEAMGMRPYYMYRQKYMRGNLENVGYAKPGHACRYNVDMMEEAANILAHGAGAMTKRVFPGRDLRVERVPAPKDIKTYINKISLLDAQKRALYLQ